MRFISSVTSSYRRPMKRLIEYTVFSGFVTAWRLATCRTRRSPDLVMATTEGVVRVPSWLGITTGSPPCITATTELVVPRSIPIILLIASFSFSNVPKTLLFALVRGSPGQPYRCRRPSSRPNKKSSVGWRCNHQRERQTELSIQVECCVVKLFDIANKIIICIDLQTPYLHFVHGF